MLLFCVALATQIGAPLSGAAEHSAMPGSRCAIVAAADAHGSSANGSPSSSHHGRADCPQCATMAAGGATLPHIVGEPFARLSLRFATVRQAGDRAPQALRVLNDGARPRAPPAA